MFEILQEWPKRQWRQATKKELAKRYTVDEGVLCENRLPGQWPDTYPLAEAHKEIGTPQEFAVLGSGGITHYRVIE